MEHQEETFAGVQIFTGARLVGLVTVHLVR